MSINTTDFAALAVTVVLFAVIYQKTYRFDKEGKCLETESLTGSRITGGTVPPFRRRTAGTRRRSRRDRGRFFHLPAKGDGGQGGQLCRRDTPQEPETFLTQIHILSWHF